jgi:hypothetical protein
LITQNSSSDAIERSPGGARSGSEGIVDVGDLDGALVRLGLVGLDGGPDDPKHRIGVPAPGVHREVVDRAILEVDVVVLAVAFLLALGAGPQLSPRGLDVTVLAVRDPRGADLLGGVEPDLEVGVVAGHPASEPRLEDQVLAVGGDLTLAAVEVPVDLGVLLGELVELEGGVAPLGREVPKDVAPGDVIGGKDVGQGGGDGRLAAADRAGDGEEHTPTRGAAQKGVAFSSARSGCSGPSG